MLPAYLDRMGKTAPKEEEQQQAMWLFSFDGEVSDSAMFWRRLAYRLSCN